LNEFSLKIIIFQFNDVVVVSGCGPIGLGMIVGAKLKSPKIVIALDVVDWKVNYNIFTTEISYS
jgi:threonine dehydrogenase-like Zn-dependent dehydrogenase